MNRSQDQQWKTIFRQEKISDALQRQGWYLISAKTIRENYGWRPRLLTKFDNHESLPSVLKEHDAAILSLTNGHYVIVRVGDRGKPFFPTLPPIWEPPRHIPLDDLPQRYHTFQWNTAFTSESMAIDAAFVSHILHDFIGETELTLTIRGRRRFSLDGRLPLRLLIDHTIREFPELHFGTPQMEIDAGYETPNGIYLIESKLHLTGNFNPRQIFFPHIYWQRQLQARGSYKTVHSLYLLYTDFFYYLYELELRDEALNALHVTRQQRYFLGEPPFTFQWLRALLERNSPIPQPAIPFPQADLLPRIYDLLKTLNRLGTRTIPQIAEQQHFTERQAHYYAAAARWLGWTEIERGQITLTKEGKGVAREAPASRAEKTLTVLSRRPVFHQALLFWCEQRTLPAQPQIEHWIAQASTEGTIKAVSGNTIHRRAQTALHWLQMLAPLVKS